jgi:hypothetical protein
MIRALGVKERQVMRYDETFRPLVVGEGRISGYLSIAFGALSVLGVLCFLFPDALTTPSLRAGYDIVWMRVLLGAGMAASAAFGLVTFVLNRQKRLGAIGIALTILAMYMGGATVQVGSPLRHAGLSWARLVHPGPADVRLRFHFSRKDRAADPRAGHPAAGFLA